MKVDRRRTFIVAGLAIVAVLLIACVSCCVLDNQSNFNGSMVKNPDLYNIEFSIMNQTDEHMMPLKAGDTVHVFYEITKGNVDLLIGMEGEKPAYRGNGITSGDFNLGITKDGTYKVTVQAKRASGSLKIELK